MKRTLLILLTATSMGSLVLGASSVLAQTPPPGGGEAGGNVSYRQKTVYDFDDDVVEGDLVRPDGEFSEARTKAKHSSLIKIREHFINEMLKSAEDI